MPDCPQGEWISGENPPVAAIPYALQGVSSPFRLRCPSHFKPPAGKKPKLRCPCSRKARGAPVISIPSLTRGELSLTNVRGAERRKARVTSIRLAAHAQCDGRSPRGAPLRRFSLDLETAFWRRTGAPFTESP